MADGSALKPAAVVARNNLARQPNESPEYRKAREALLAEEIELNRHIARVATQRRALPPGGEVKGEYQFLGEASSVQGANPVTFEALFGDKDTLFVYNWMYGPKRPDFRSTGKLVSGSTPKVSGPVDSAPSPPGWAKRRVYLHSG